MIDLISKSSDQANILIGNFVRRGVFFKIPQYFCSAGMPVGAAPPPAAAIYTHPGHPPVQQPAAHYPAATHYGYAYPTQAAAAAPGQWSQPGADGGPPLPPEPHPDEKANMAHQVLQNL